MLVANVVSCFGEQEAERLIAERRLSISALIIITIIIIMHRHKIAITR